MVEQEITSDLFFVIHYLWSQHYTSRVKDTGH